MNTENSSQSQPPSSSDLSQTYRTRGLILPLCGAITCILFAILVPIWCVIWAGVSPFTILAIGTVPMILAIPCHVLGGKRESTRLSDRWRTGLYCAGILLNAVSTSLCMSAYYVFIEAKPTVTPLVAGTLLTLGLYAVMALLMRLWPQRYALLTGIVALAALALMVVSIVFWVQNHNKLFFSFVFFNLLWGLISVIALHVACSDEGSPALRFASFASFGIFIAVAAIVLIILACAGGDCDCDCGDCCDCSDSRGHGKKKSKTKATGVAGATTAAISHEIVDEVKKREKQKEDDE